MSVSDRHGDELYSVGEEPMTTACRFATQRPPCAYCNTESTRACDAEGRGRFGRCGTRMCERHSAKSATTTICAASTPPRQSPGGHHPTPVQSYRRKLWMSEKGDVPFLGKLSCRPQSPGGNRGKGTPPMLKVITTEAEAPAGEGRTLDTTLDDLARDGARRMIAAALQLEVAEYVAGFRDSTGVVRVRVLAWRSSRRGSCECQTRLTRSA
jgi:hypothetical protein